MSSDTPITEKYFALVPDRQCGECMICCEYLPISCATLKKPAETLCPHCIVNKGCSIYQQRANVCRTWHCLWRRDGAMPDELRPDRSGIIFSLVVHEEPRYLFEDAHITCMAVKTKAVFEAPLVSATIQRYIAEGVLPVWHSFGGGKTLVWPGEELADAILNPATTRLAELVPQGKAWRERYESLIEPLQVANGRFDSLFIPD
ncbi:MAG: hypothetical protein H6R04_372 [Burkholderiaceae bacterium]|nr:hypothetical protein [Burkholderiaceae bacterium]